MQRSPTCSSPCQVHLNWPGLVKERFIIKVDSDHKWAVFGGQGQQLTLEQVVEVVEDSVRGQPIMTVPKFVPMGHVRAGFVS